MLIALALFALSPASAMADAGTITGTVTDANGTPIQNIAVVATDTSTDTSESPAYTDSNGSYTITLADTPASYTVEFEPNGQNYIPQYYDGASSPGSATDVNVSSGGTASDINATMATGGVVSGTISGAQGGAGITVSVVDASGYDCPAQQYDACSTTTDANGNYSIVGLPSGTYYVEATPQSGQNYQPTFYDGALSFQSANQVGVTVGQTSTASFSMATGAEISGTVNDATVGGPAANVYVEAITPDDSYETGATTGANGQYTIVGLPTGSYKLQLSGGNYLTEFYNGSPSLGGGATVSTTAGSAATAQTVNLPEASQGGTISGTVDSATTGEPVGGVSVEIDDSAGNSVAQTATAVDGTYSVSSLLAGSYKVEFVPNGGSLAFQYFSNQTSVGSANVVSVSAGGTTPNVNAALTTGGTMSGTVTDASTHAGLSGVSVDIEDASGNVLTSASTKPDGTYTVTGIPAGTYHVEFVPFGATLPGGAPYSDQYYSDQITLAGSNPVSITSGANTPNINAALVPVSSVTAPVTVITNTIAPPLGAKPGGATVSKGSLSGIAKRKATLKFTLTAGSNGAPKLKSFKVKLPSGLRFIAKGLKKGLKISGGGKYTAKITKGQLLVTLRGTSGKIAVTVSSRAVSVSKSLAAKAKKHKVASLKVGVSVTDAQKHTSSMTLTFKHPT